MNIINGLYDTWSNANRLDEEILRDRSEENESIRFEVRLNNVGRMHVLGHVVGIARLIRGVVVLPLGLIAAFFAAVAAGVTYPFKREFSKECVESAKRSADASLDGLLHIPRAILEILPFTGLILARYDIWQHESGKWKK